MRLVVMLKRFFCVRIEFVLQNQELAGLTSAYLVSDRVQNLFVQKFFLQSQNEMTVYNFPNQIDHIIISI
jgi:hypothetical protein